MDFTLDLPNRPLTINGQDSSFEIGLGDDKFKIDSSLAEDGTNSLAQIM